ncbi:MAG: sulfur carrier protein ThiS [bacterium]
MQLTLNGELRTVEKELTLAALLETLSLADRRVAVMINQEVVRRGEFPQKRLQDGDTVDIIHMVGGG